MAYQAKQISELGKAESLASTDVFQLTLNKVQNKFFRASRSRL